MQQLSLSTDRQVPSLEASIPGMIRTTLADIVTPLSTTVDALADNIKVCEYNQLYKEEVMALEVVIAELRKDMDYLKSTYISMVIGVVETLDVPEMCQTTTRHENRLEKATEIELYEETNDEMFEEKEETADGETDCD